MINSLSNRNTIKKQFIELLKQEKDFASLSRTEQIHKTQNILEKVFEITKIYLTNREKNELVKEVLENIVFGLRKIQQLQDDDNIEEIMVNSCDNVYIKKRFSDSYKKTNINFDSEEEIHQIIEKLLEGTGKRVDRSNPLVDIRLKDGSRANITVRPLSIKGPSITIRKFPKQNITPDDLLDLRFCNKKIMNLIKQAVSSKKNILISGGTASGKTTTLSALLHFISGGENGDRVIIIEDTAEIKLPDHIDNYVRLETRPANIEGQGEYNIRSLLKNALRMKPDRIIIGEVRGQEAFDLIQAMNTGHPGSFATVHANSCSDAVERLQALILLAGFSQLPINTIKKWIYESIDLVIQVQKYNDGVRRVKEICELKPDIGLKQLYEYENKEQK